MRPKSSVADVCSYLNCKSIDTGELKFFPFPVHRPDICQKWVQNCQRKQLNYLPFSKLKYRLVCELHFVSTCFNATAEGVPILSEEAVPTLDAPGNENIQSIFSFIYDNEDDDSSRLTPVNEMESLDSACFVCDKTIMTDKWKYKLKTTATKRTNVPVSDMIQLLVGDDFEVLVGECDAVCNTCMKSLNEMDALTDQLAKVKSQLSRLLNHKYGLTSDDDNDDQPQVENKSNHGSTKQKAKKLLKCEKCGYKTDLGKDLKYHMETHIATAKTPNSTSRKRSTKYSEDEYWTPNVKLSSKKKQQKLLSIENKSKTIETKGKSLEPVSNKKKEIHHFQCSKCNVICKNKGAMTNHIKSKHGRRKYVVAESEDEYEDIETLDDELAGIKNKTNKQKLDFLDDWDDEESGEILPKKPKIETNNIKLTKQKKNTKQTKKGNYGQKVKGKPSKTQYPSLIANNLTKKIPDLEGESDKEDQNEDFEEISAKPTCMFCNSTFFSIEAVKDHVKLIHGDSKSNLKLEESSCQKNNVLATATNSNIEERNTKKFRLKKLYKCNLCGIRKLTFQLIRIHINAHQRHVAFKCKFCGSQLKKLASFKAHQLKCWKIGLALKKCKHCTLFFYASDMKKHVKSVHILSKHRRIPKDMPKASQLNLKLSQKNNAGSLKDIKRNKTDLQNQRSVNKKQNGIKCDSCDEYFTQKGHLLDHKIRHEIKDCSKFGICIWCSKLFGDKANLEIHLEKEHGSWLTKKSCSLCSNKEFFTKREFKLHFLKNHFPQKTKVILKEMLEFKDNTVEEEFSKVIKELHDITGEGSDIDESKISRPIKFCPVCDFKTQNEEEVKNHQATHKENYCNICQIMLKRRICLDHANLHSLQFRGEKCSVCQKLFHDDLHLMNHFQINHPECKNKCNMCTNSFLTQKDLLKHKNEIHGGQLQVLKTCEKCEMKFLSKKSFESHEEFAHRPSLSCKFCDKTFSSFKMLVTHEKKHLTKVKSVYKCSVCGKVLKSVTSLKTHKKLNHTRSSLQICETCGKKCRSMFSFREHLASHSEDLKKKYHCQTCEKGFYFYEAHFRHQKVHRDSALFKCRLCQIAFPSLSYLKKHLKQCIKS